jgi:hypothetical protein
MEGAITLCPFGPGRVVPAQTPLSGSGEAEMLQGERMSANLPAMLGVTPLLGRSFRSEEEQQAPSPSS